MVHEVEYEVAGVPDGRVSIRGPIVLRADGCLGAIVKAMWIPADGSTESQWRSVPMSGFWRRRLFRWRLRRACRWAEGWVRGKARSRGPAEELMATMREELEAEEVGDDGTRDR